MGTFLKDTMHIAADGNLHVNEIILIAIAVVIAMIVVLLIRDAVKKSASRQRTIFSHRKNRYKTRIGKKPKG